jgi:hypothetical protein
MLICFEFLQAQISLLGILSLLALQESAVRREAIAYLGTNIPDIYAYGMWPVIGIRHQ